MLGFLPAPLAGQALPDFPGGIWFLLPSVTKHCCLAAWARCAVHLVLVLCTLALPHLCPAAPQWWVRFPLCVSPGVVCPAPPGGCAGECTDMAHTGHCSTLEPQGSVLELCPAIVHVSQHRGKGPCDFHGFGLVVKIWENLVVDVQCLVSFGSHCDWQ